MMPAASRGLNNRAASQTMWNQTPAFESGLTMRSATAAHLRIVSRAERFSPNLLCASAILPKMCGLMTFSFSAIIIVAPMALASRNAFREVVVADLDHSLSHLKQAGLARNVLGVVLVLPERFSLFDPFYQPLRRFNRLVLERFLVVLGGEGRGGQQEEKSAQRRNRSIKTHRVLPSC